MSALDVLTNGLGKPSENYNSTTSGIVLKANTKLSVSNTYTMCPRTYVPIIRHPTDLVSKLTCNILFLVRIIFSFIEFYILYGLKMISAQHTKRHKKYYQL